MSIPSFWKTNLAEITQEIGRIKKGRKQVICTSAGGREVWACFYGRENRLNRRANFSSASGAGDLSCYADRGAADYRRCIIIVGCIHGAEFEGTAAIMNLIKILETGKDYAGNSHPKLKAAAEKLNLVLVPCINPDGRSHVPFDTMAGRSYEDLRRYNQGTWKDGSLCEWPDCKKVHPIKDYVDYLGGYYNDDGINLMHDNFFAPMAKETKALFELFDKYAPDFSALLHGGANCTNVILRLDYATEKINNQLAELADRIYDKCMKCGLPFRKYEAQHEKSFEKNPYNLASALMHSCGAPCIVYETNQGLGYGDVRLNYDEIYNEHLILFEEMFESAEV